MSKPVLDKRPTAMMPVTTMEEVPLLDERERAEMLASLKEAEAQIAAGNFTVHDPATFVDEMMAVREAAKQSRKV